MQECCPIDLIDHPSPSTTRRLSHAFEYTEVANIFIVRGDAPRIMEVKMKNQKGLPPDLQKWVDARKRFHLSHRHIQMARELGLNPKKFGKLPNHKQEPWKIPLPEFIEHLYFKDPAKLEPAKIWTIEEVFRLALEKKKHRKKDKMRATAANLEPVSELPVIEGS